MLNKVTLIGNLGQDPELRYTQSQMAVCNFPLATSERWKDSNGENQEKTEWHQIVIWGKVAENCSKYLVKGSTIYLEGKIQTEKYEKDGSTRYTTKIIAREVKFLSKSEAKQESESRPDPKPESKPDDEISLEDIPF